MPTRTTPRHPTKPSDPPPAAPAAKTWPWLVVAHRDDGAQTTGYPTKKAAKAAGAAMRLAGLVAFVYDAATAALAGVQLPEAA